MDMLVQLGVNKTYFLQLALFIFAIFILSQHVFKDFVELLAKREEQTKGSESIAAEEHQKAASLYHTYEEKARDMNNAIRTIFDSYRQEATAEYEKIVTKARQESTKLVDETRHRVSVEIGDAARKLQEEAPLVAQAMAAKLLSKGRGV